MKKLFFTYFVIFPYLSLGCCAEEQLSDQELGKKCALAHIQNLKVGANYYAKWQLSAIATGVESNIDTQSVWFHENFGSPLVESIWTGNPLLVDLVLEAKADPNLISKDLPPLMHLAKLNLPVKESEKMADLLIKAKARVDACVKQETALSLSMQNRRPHLVKALVEARASLEMRTGPDQLTPLEIVTRNKKKHFNLVAYEAAQERHEAARAAQEKVALLQESPEEIISQIIDQAGYGEEGKENK